MTVEGWEPQRDHSAFLPAFLLSIPSSTESYRGRLSRDGTACLQPNPSPRRPTESRRGKQRVV